jgi:hypothetical protein
MAGSGSPCEAMGVGGESAAPQREPPMQEVIVAVLFVFMLLAPCLAMLRDSEG